MAKMIHYNELYEFESPAEENSAKLLSIANVHAIKNFLYTEQMRRNNIEVDPANIMAFIQEEAEIKGAVRAFQLLLDSHNDLIATLNSQSQLYS